MIYQGPVKDATAYFSSIGFDMDELMNPADFFLDIANGAIKRKGDDNFTPPDLFRFWANKLAGRELDAPAVTQESRVRAVTIAGSPEDVAQLNAIENPAMDLESLRLFTLLFIFWLWGCILSPLIYLHEGAIVFVESFTKKDEIRVTPGFFGQLGFCMHRAFKQKYRRYGAFASQMLIHMGVAVVVSSVSTDLQYVGPLPDTICETVTRDLYNACTSPLQDSYQGTANFLCFGMIFAAISISTGTFGLEQVFLPWAIVLIIFCLILFYDVGQLLARVRCWA